MAKTVAPILSCNQEVPHSSARECSLVLVKFSVVSSFDGAIEQVPWPRNTSSNGCNVLAFPPFEGDLRRFSLPKNTHIHTHAHTHIILAKKYMCDCYYYTGKGCLEALVNESG